MEVGWATSTREVWGATTESANNGQWEEGGGVSNAWEREEGQTQTVETCTL